MGKRIRGLLLGLVVALVSLTGLVAVSALVPDVGCEKRSPDFLETGTRIRFSLPAQISTGQSFTANGTLERGAFPGVELPPGGGNEKNAEPFPHQRVIIDSPFFVEIVTTDEEGKFSCEIKAKVPGDYRVEATYPGDQMRYYRRTSERHSISVTGDAPTVQPADLSWTRYATIVPILLLGAYLLYRRLALRHKGEREQRRTPWPSLKASKELTRWLPWVLLALVMGAMLYALVPRGPSTVRRVEDRSRVVTRTRLSVPPTANPGKPFRIDGKLTAIEAGAEIPKGGQGISIFVISANGIEERAATLTTDNVGVFDTSLILDIPGQYEISAVFDDTGDLYIESSDVKNVAVGGSKPVFGDWNSPGWLSVILGIPLTVFVAIAAYLYYRHYRRTQLPEPRNAETLAVSTPVTSPPRPARLAGLQSPLKIAFPQITGPFPDVWGKRDDLLIVFTLGGGEHPLVKTSLEIELGPESRTEAELGQGGTTSWQYRFDTAGSYEIRAALSGRARNGYEPASRLVRIVDYREEIVRLYNEMVASLSNGGMALTPKMTAREVETRLVRRMPELKREAVAQVVLAFEEANYSLHPMTRSAYERMYLASLEVKNQILTSKPGASFP